MLDSIKNLLQFINDNWASIVVIISLIAGIAKKVLSYLDKSKEEKIGLAKTQIKEIALKFTADAEVDYENWNKAGSIKRSQVIHKIFNEYPVLSQVADQESIINWIDETINNALKELRKIVAENQVVQP